MKREVYHVVYNKNGPSWRIKHKQIIIFEHTHKKNTMDEAKKLAKSHEKGQVVEHKKDGVIAREYTYGDDPKKTKG